MFLVLGQCRCVDALGSSTHQYFTVFYTFFFIISSLLSVSAGNLNRVSTQDPHLQAGLVAAVAVLCLMVPFSGTVMVSMCPLTPPHLNYRLSSLYIYIIYATYHRLSAPCGSGHCLQPSHTPSRTTTHVKGLYS